MGGYSVKVEEARAAADGKPSAGAVYRCIYAKDGLMEMPQDLHSPWEFFRYSDVSFFKIMLKKVPVLVK